MPFRSAAIGLLLLLSNATVVVSQSHPVPSNRASLKADDWFPYVFSKIAPLEWWSFAASPADVKREHYPDDESFKVAQGNTWTFPRFCFSLFRPSPEAVLPLYQVIDEYKGGVVWSMVDDCISAFPAKPTFYSLPTNADGSPMNQQQMMEMLEKAAKAHADPAFVAKAMQDAPQFCAWLEKRLGLEQKAPQQFDPQWLTREGLASSRGPYEEFFEPGSWSVVLSAHPDQIAIRNGEDVPGDRSLNMGIGMSENDALFNDLGGSWEKYQARGGKGPILPQYPLISRLDDITEDTIYRPGEIDALMAEYLRAQAEVKDPRAIRGLDILIRIARLAQSMKMGIYFGGQ